MLAVCRWSSVGLSSHPMRMRMEPERFSHPPVRRSSSMPTGNAIASNIQFGREVLAAEGR